MALLTEKSGAAFDVTQIRPGHLLYGRHSTWDCGKSGIVTAVSEDQLRVQYHPGIGNITNHFVIPAVETAAGEWQIRWSADLSEVLAHNMPDNPGAGTEGSHESGGTDI